MAQLYPGDYLRNITIEAIDAVRGAGLFTWENQRCYLLNRDIPSLTLRPGVRIDKLVCLSDDGGRCQCIPPGGYSRLAQVLYNNGHGGIRSYIDRKYGKMWRARWRAAAGSTESISCVPIQVKKSLSLTGRTWMGLRAADWEMPVPMSILHDAFAGRPSFYPAPMERSWKQSKMYGITGQPVYRDDGWNIPKDSNLQLRLHSLSNCAELQDDLPVTLHIHPPIDPKKLHFTARKHMFSSEEISPERNYWQCLFKHMGQSTELPLEEINTIFSGCVANAQNSNCAPCKPEKFKQTHVKIKKFLHESVQLSVTFLPERITEKSEGSLLTLEKLFPSVFGIKMALQGDMPWSRHCGGSQHRFVYRGLLYIEPDKYHGHLHLAPLTQYMAGHGLANIILGGKLILGKLYHVQTSD